MSILEIKKLRSSYRERNRRLLEAYQKNHLGTYRTFKAGEVVDGNSLSVDTVFYVNSGNCVRYIVDTQGNNQALALVGPTDILGLGTRLNYLRINGGMRIIEKMAGIEIPMALLLEWTKTEPLFMYENMQYDLFSANSALRMNSMEKRTKIFYTLIELLRDNHVKIGNSLRLKPYISQGVIGEFTGSSKGYVSKVISELREAGIFNPYSTNLICDKPEKLIELSESHQDFSLEDIFY